MKRWTRLLLLACAVAFVGLTAAGWLGGSTIAAIVVAAIVVGFLWMLALDLRRGPARPAAHAAQDAAFTAAALATFHVANPGGTDTPAGFDSIGGGGGDF